MPFNIFNRPLTLFFGLVLLGGCYTHTRIEPGVETSRNAYAIDQVIRNVTYTPEAWSQSLGADLYLPKNRSSTAVVLMVHGGSWASRDRSDMDGISEKLARNGYAVFNISYRFAPDNQHPAQLQDLQQALIWLQKNADKYQLDTSRINTWGYSSGAHLASLIATIDRDSKLLIPDINSLPRIRAVVAGGIPADLRKYHQSPIVKRFLGGDNHEMPQRYADASPAYHISADDPPTFLYHGKMDLLVEPEQSIDFYDALITAGVDAELYLHSWLGHLTMFLLGGDAEDKAIEFLNRKNT